MHDSLNSVCVCVCVCVYRSHRTNYTMNGRFWQALGNEMLKYFGHLGCFYIMAIVNNAAMNTGVLIFCQISALGSFRYIPRRGITGSGGRSIFNFGGYFLTAFYSGCTILEDLSIEVNGVLKIPDHDCISIDLSL